MTSSTCAPRMRERLRCSSGQSLIEGAIVMPLLVLVVMGVVELGSALRDQLTVSRLAREGSNLISRDVPLEAAGNALVAMSSGPVNFGSNGRLIFTVLKRGGTQGTNNYNRLVMYQRYQYGSFSATSRLSSSGSVSFGAAPDYTAANSDSNTSLRVTNAPANLVTVLGGLVYVTEIFASHTSIAPLDRFGVVVPSQLYSIAYF